MEQKSVLTSIKLFDDLKTYYKAKATIILVFLLQCVTQATFSQTRQQITPLKDGDKVLWLGNSYSGFYGPTYDAINSLLKASSPALQNVTFGNKGKGMGLVLEYATWKSLGVIDEIKKGGWTYVVIQSWEDAFYRWDSETLEDGSKNPNPSGSRDEAARIKSRDVLLANIKILDAEIKKIGAKTILFEPHPSTWDYEYIYVASQKTYSEILPSLNVVHAPLLWAWDKVRIDYPPSRFECSGSNSDGFIKMLYSDCGHQNWNGTALDAYTFYTMFTGKSPVGLSPTHEVFSNMNADKNYLAGIGYKTGLEIIALNNSGDSEVPSAPTNLQSSNITSSSFILAWNASTDNKGVASYEIFEGTTSKGTSSTTTFNVTGLKANTSFNITVKSKDAAGNVSVASAVKIVKTLASTDNVAPTVPTALVATALTINSFTLSWAASTDNDVVTGYEIFRNGSSIGTSATTSLNVTGLMASTSYKMTVKAKDAADNTSAASAELNVATLEPDTQAPSVPTNLNTTGLSATTFTLNWAASTDNLAVVRYEVYMNGKLYGNTTSTETNMPIPFLNPATTYTMSVKAKDAAGNTSAASINLIVTTSAAPAFTMYEAENAERIGGGICTDVLGYSGTGFWCNVSKVGSSLTFTVNSATSGTSTITCRFANGMDGTQSFSLYVNGTKLKKTTFPTTQNWDTWANKAENVKLNAGSNSIMYKYDSEDNGNVNIDYINISSIITGQDMENNGLTNLSIYPNPATSNLNINFGQDVDKVEVSICDLQGRILMNRSINNTSFENLNISTLNSGSYLLKITDTNKTHHLKFFKQ